MNNILKKTSLLVGTATITLGLLIFTGEENINRIKDKISNMTSKIISISNDRDTVLNKLQDTLNKYNTDVEALNQKKAELENNIVELNKKIESGNGNIIELKQQKNELEQQKNELQDNINELNNQLSEKNSTIINLNNEITRLNNEVKKANSAVEDLEKFVNGKFDEVNNIPELTDLSGYVPTISPDISSDDEEFTSTFNINRNNDAQMEIGTLDLEYTSTCDRLRIIADTLYYPDSKLNVNLEIYFEDGRVLTYTLTPPDPSAALYLKNGSRIYKLKMTGIDRFNNIVKENIKIQFN